MKEFICFIIIIACIFAFNSFARKINQDDNDTADFIPGLICGIIIVIIIYFYDVF